MADPSPPYLLKPHTGREPSDYFHPRYLLSAMVFIENACWIFGQPKNPSFRNSNEKAL
jgi:hypothetical protein